MSSKDSVNQATVYKFLKDLISHSVNNGLDGLELLQDIIVNNCLLPNGDGEQFVSMPDNDIKIAEYMLNGQKIEAVKYAREVFGFGLKEAKDYVESKNWSESGQKLTFRQIAVKSWMEKVANDYSFQLH